MSFGIPVRNGLGLGLLASTFLSTTNGSAIFSPLSLFAAGEEGGWYDPSAFIADWRRNLLTYTEQFDNAAWTKTALVTTGTPPWVNVAVSPDGTTTADKIIPDTSNTTHQIYSAAITVAAGTRVTTSLYAKADGYSWIAISAYDSTEQWTFFDVTNGVVGGSAAGNTGSITSVGNGWYRCSVTRTIASTTTYGQYLVSNANNVQAFIGNGTSGALIWGAQVEIASSASTYQQIITPEITYESLYTSVLYQSSSGQTPVTVVEQPVGLMLDTRKGPVFGSNIITNGTFATDTNWTKGTGWSIGSGVATKTAGSAANLSQTVTIPAGWYKVSFDLTVTAGSVTATFTGGTTASGFGGTTSGVYTAFILSTGNTAFSLNASSTFAGTVDNVVVSSVAGNHVRQGTAANRPVLSARYNLLTYTEQFDNAVWIEAGTKTITAGSIIAPNGTATAETLTADVGTSTYAFVYTTVTLPGDVNHTYSVAVKKDNYRYTALSLQWAIDRYLTVVFDLDGTSGAATQTLVGSLSGTVVSTSQVSLGNGWYRLTVTGRGSGSNPVYPWVGFATGATGNTVDNVGRIIGNWAGTESFYVWGADLRATNDGVGLPVYQRVGAASNGSGSAAGVGDYDTTGFPVYLRFDGSNSALSTATTVDFSATDKMSVFAGVRKLSDTAIGTVVELSSTIVSNNGTFLLTAPHAVSNATFEYESKGTTLRDALASGVAAPITRVVTGLSDIGADQCVIRLNGTQIDSDTGDQGTGNYGTYTLFLGARNGNSNRFNGRLYNLIVRGASTTGTTLTNTETWVNGKTKAY